MNKFRAQGAKLADGSIDLEERGPSNLKRHISPGIFSRLVFSWCSAYVSLAYRNGTLSGRCRGVARCCGFFG